MSVGVWEAIVDKAILEVSRHLSALTVPFDVTSVTAQHMLTLLDATTLFEIVVERNMNGLCGFIGCTEKPRSQQKRKDAHTARHLLANHATGLSRINNGENNNNNNSGGGGDAYNESEEDEDYSEEDKNISNVFRCYDRYRRRLDAALSHSADSNENNSKTENNENMCVAVGAPRADRFCSDDCQTSMDKLRSLSQRFLVYEQSAVLHAVAALFPNLKMETLRRLTAAESADVANVKEKKEVVRHASAPEVVAMGPMCVGNARTSAVQRKCGQNKSPVSLVVYDWLFTVVTAQTRSKVAQLARRNTLRMRAASKTPHNFEEMEKEMEKEKEKEEEERSLYVRCMAPIAAAAALRDISTNNLIEPFVVHPPLQQERSAVVARRVFSAETSAALSRLLLFDYEICAAAWDFWQSAASGTSLLATLQFPFALPGDIFGGATNNAALLFLAVAMAAAAGICVPFLWNEWRRPEIALAELLDALGATPEDLTDCVKLLVLE